jgi:hypothetical protein
VSLWNEQSLAYHYAKNNKTKRTAMLSRITQLGRTITKMGPAEIFFTNFFQIAFTKKIVSDLWRPFQFVCFFKKIRIATTAAAAPCFVVFFF